MMDLKTIEILKNWAIKTSVTMAYRNFAEKFYGGAVASLGVALEEDWSPDGAIYCVCDIKAYDACGELVLPDPATPGFDGAPLAFLPTDLTEDEAYLQDLCCLPLPLEDYIREEYVRVPLKLPLVDDSVAAIIVLFKDHSHDEIWFTD